MPSVLAGARLLVLLPLLAGALAAQDTIRLVEGVRVGITYTPGLRPGLLVLGGPKQELLDSVRAGSITSAAGVRKRPA